MIRKFRKLEIAPAANTKTGRIIARAFGMRARMPGTRAAGRNAVASESAWVTTMGAVRKSLSAKKGSSATGQAQGPNRRCSCQAKKISTP